MGKMVTPTRIYGRYNQEATSLPEGQIPQEAAEREDQTLGFHNMRHIQVSLKTLLEPPAEGQVETPDVHLDSTMATDGEVNQKMVCTNSKF